MLIKHIINFQWYWFLAYFGTLNKDCIPQSCKYDVLITQDKMQLNSSLMVKIFQFQCTLCFLASCLFHGIPFEILTESDFFTTENFGCHSWWRYASNLANYQQHDAHEFFICMLDGIHEKEQDPCKRPSHGNMLFCIHLFFLEF